MPGSSRWRAAIGPARRAVRPVLARARPQCGGVVRRPSGHQNPARLPNPANDNGRGVRLRAKVLVPKDLPVTQMEIEVFALLLDDLKGLVTNDNEDRPE